MPYVMTHVYWPVMYRVIHRGRWVHTMRNWVMWMVSWGVMHWRMSRLM